MTEIWKEWYKRPYPWARRSDSRIKYLVLHHTAGPPSQSPETIKAYHEKERKWPHIGYHFVVTPYGVYKTLPINAVPVCVREHNAESICVAITGDWSREVPVLWKSPHTAMVMRVLARVVGEILKAYPGIKLVRHRDLVPTGCPGTLTWDMVLNWEKEVRNA